MERHENIVTPVAPRAEASGPYIDWAAVLGGVVVAAAIGGLCTTFGAAIGLSSISAEPGEGSFNLWVIVTAVWLVITLVLSYLAGGYVAGRMRRRVADANADETAARDGINGLVVWGLGVLLTGWMAAGVISGAGSAVGTAVSAAGSVAGTAVSAAGSAIGGAAQGVGSAVGQAVQGVAQGAGAAVSAAADGADSDDTAGLMDYINSTLMRPALTGAQQSNDGLTNPGTPSTDNAELSRQTGIVLGNVLRTGEISDEDRQFVIAAVAQRTGQSQAQVEARVDEAVKRVQDARAEAARIAEEAKAEAERLAAEAKAEAERLAKEAEEAAIAAAETARKTAILSAFLLTAAALVAGAASVIGAVRGGKHRDENRVWGGFSYRA